MAIRGREVVFFVSRIRQIANRLGSPALNAESARLLLKARNANVGAPFSAHSSSPNVKICDYRELRLLFLIICDLCLQGRYFLSD